jgi:hypothetical protein
MPGVIAELSRRFRGFDVAGCFNGLRRDAEWNSLWVLLVAATTNVALGVWRPLFS